MVRRTSSGTSPSVWEAGEASLGPRAGVCRARSGTIWLTFLRHHKMGRIHSLLWNLKAQRRHPSWPPFTDSPVHRPDPLHPRARGYPSQGHFHVGPSLTREHGPNFPGSLHVADATRSRVSLGHGRWAHRTQHSGLRGWCHSGQFIRKIYGWENKSLEEQKPTLNTLSICSWFMLTPQPQLRGDAGANRAFNWAPDLRRGQGRLQRKQPPWTEK